MVETLVTAAEQVEAVLPVGGGVAEVVADKGYHTKSVTCSIIALPPLGSSSVTSNRQVAGTREPHDANARRPRRASNSASTTTAANGIAGVGVLGCTGRP